MIKEHHLDLESVEIIDQTDTKSEFHQEKVCAKDFMKLGSGKE